MIKRKILTIIALIGSFFCISNAALEEVTVPVDFLHEPAAGLGYLGKVSYTLTIDTTELGFYEYDSIFVELEIVPENGGDPLDLDAVEGAVGVIHILPKEPQETSFSLFRKCQRKIQGQVKCKLHDRDRGTFKKTKAMCKEASVKSTGKAVQRMASTEEEEFPTHSFEQEGSVLHRER